MILIFLAKFLVFDPLGCPFVGPPSTVMHLIMKIYHQGLTSMFLWLLCVMLPNSPN
jgi:hypothetical protein